MYFDARIANRRAKDESGGIRDSRNERIRNFLNVIWYINSVLKQVDTYVYLGSLVTMDGEYDKEIRS